MAGEVVATPGDMFPLKQEPPNALLGRNTSTEWRRILFDSLFGTGPLLNGWSITREGVLPRRIPTMNGIIPNFRDLLVRPRTTPGQGVLVDPGIFGIYRGKAVGSVHEGLYVGAVVDTAVDLPMPAAEAGQNRIDTVFARLTDKNIVADAAATTPHGPSFGYATGTPTAGALVPAGTPGTAGAPPVVPEGCLPLWDVPRSAGVNTITQTVIDAGVDRRKSMGLRGGPRVLLPGDSVSEGGAVPGEITVLPPTATRPQTITRVWDGLAWRLLSPFMISTTPNIGTAGSPLGVPNTLASITVPDIGCPYRVKVHGTTRMRMQAVNSYAQMVARLNTTTGPITRMGEMYKPTITSAVAEFPYFGGGHGVFPHATAAALTGSNTFLWRIEVPGGDTVVWHEPVTNVDGSPGAHQFSVEVLPA